MATIGLDKLYYATITENPDTGEETYAKHKPLAKAISAELSVEVAEAILYADDGASEIVKEFKSGTLHRAMHSVCGSCFITGFQTSQVSPNPCKNTTFWASFIYAARKNLQRG